MIDKRIHVFYSGRVQGVGFRYTVESVASKLGLTGWVRNMRDGRVEAVCEGGDKALRSFLDDIRNGFPDYYIKDAQVSWEEPAHEFDKFEIRF